MMTVGGISKVAELMGFENDWAFSRDKNMAVQGLQSTFWSRGPSTKV